MKHLALSIKDGVVQLSSLNRAGGLNRFFLCSNSDLAYGQFICRRKTLSDKLPIWDLKWKRAHWNRCCGIANLTETNLSDWPQRQGFVIRIDSWQCMLCWGRHWVSIGSKGDRYDNAMSQRPSTACTRLKLSSTEAPAKQLNRWNGQHWSRCLDHHRQMEPLDYSSPAEAEID